jgi:hypothetical protein
MTRTLVSGALGGLVLTLALAACGSSTEDPGGGAADASDKDETSASSSPEGSREEITPAGVAAIVLEHLGEDTVVRFLDFGPEPGSASVMVQLSDRTPHNFAVSVYSAEQAAGEIGGAGKCPPKNQLPGDSRCRVLDNGTAVTTMTTPYGFSDDNTKGMVISSTAVTKGNGAAMAMYESYDKSPAVSPAEIEAILADERLGWITDPAVNDAGEDVELQKHTG